jgi:hypothetical protein
MKYPLPKLPNISANGMRSKLTSLHLVVIRHVEYQVTEVARTASGRNAMAGYWPNPDGREFAQKKTFALN